MFYCVLIALALAVLWVLPLYPAPVILLSLAIAVWGTFRLLRDARLYVQDSCVAFRLEGGEAVMLVQRSGRHVPGRILASTFVTPFLVILNVAPEGSLRIRSLVLAQDCMAGQSYRRLRVALRWGTEPDQSGR